VGKLEGKVALVTGGARGQGRAHAVALAAEGADVAICDIAAPVPAARYPMADRADLDATVAAVEAVGRRCVALEADVRDSVRMREVVASSVAELGRLDIACANAGVFTAAPLHEVTDEAWGETIDILLTGVANTLRAVAPRMIEQRYGRIITTASEYGKRGAHGCGAYCAAKWGVIGLTKCAALELGQFNITANAICPGYVATEMINNQPTYDLFFPDETPVPKERVDEFILDVEVHMPVARLDPAEVSRAVIFLASDEARFVSGSTLDVSAGQTANLTA
jgi:SDR family mycofactocin-dependent oxidoreductase